jgi:Cu-Zn family superoxide dismutase
MIKYIVLIFFIIMLIPINSVPVKAVCVLKSNKINGVIYLEELSTDKTKIFGKISGLNKNSQHAIHIHESGDLTENCKSLCAHYNPFNKKHGGPNDDERHVGDLGNLSTDDNGYCQFEIIDKLVKLRGEYSVLGRSIVIHEGTDDLGLGGHNDSHITGHAGARIVCGIIGHSKTCKN